MRKLMKGIQSCSVVGLADPTTPLLVENAPLHLHGGDEDFSSSFEFAPFKLSKRLISSLLSSTCECKEEHRKDDRSACLTW